MKINPPMIIALVRGCREGKRLAGGSRDQGGVFINVNVPKKSGLFRSLEREEFKTSDRELPFGKLVIL